MKKEEQNNISNTLSAIFLFAGQTLRSVTAWFVLCLFLVLTLTYVRLFTDYPSNKNWPELYGIVSNLLSGTVVSFLFYYLVVVVPESRKRNILRTNLARTYKILKEDILWQIVFASQKGGRTDLDTTSEFVRKLLDVAEFKKAFADGKEADEGFYAFENQMSDRTPEFEQIIELIVVLRGQIEFLLNNYIIDNQELFDFFKRLEMRLALLRNAQPGYDESKPLCRFLWELCAGFSFIDGYRGYDLIEKSIDSI